MNYIKETCKDLITSKERILRAINHLEVDRIPLDYWGVSEITDKLFSYYGVKCMKDLSKSMKLDKIMYCGPYPKNGMGYWDAWGIEMKKVMLPGNQGVYEEPIKAVLAEYDTIDEIRANYSFPTTDMYDYSVIPQQIKDFEGYAVEGGYTSVTYMYEMLRGTENMLVDFALEPELAKYILGEIQSFSYDHMKKTLEYGDGRIDLAQVTDDFGSQNNLLISLSMIDEYLGDIYEENIKLVKSYDAKVFHHDDGAMIPALDWLVNKGIDVLNPLQWHLPTWNIAELKAQYGQTLSFHGGIDNQFVLPFGTKNQIIEEVRTCIDILFADKTGYILAPCHNIQANTPIENILLMYDEAINYLKE